MRTKLRNIRTGEYLQSPQSWTTSPGLALDFGSVKRALELVNRQGLRDMELVLSEEQGPSTFVPVAKLASHYPGVVQSAKARSRRPRL